MTTRDGTSLLKPPPPGSKNRPATQGMTTIRYCCANSKLEGSLKEPPRDAGDDDLGGAQGRVGAYKGLKEPPRDAGDDDLALIGHTLRSLDAQRTAPRRRG